MALNSSITSPGVAQPATQFPKLMISGRDLVVLFDGTGSGVVLHPGRSQHRIGYRSNKWGMDHFKAFSGQVSVFHV